MIGTDLGSWTDPGLVVEGIPTFRWGGGDLRFCKYYWKSPLEIEKVSVCVGVWGEERWVIRNACEPGNFHYSESKRLFHVFYK